MAKQATTVVELLMGLGGKLTSGGCVQMWQHLNSLPWCICNIRAWDDWRRSAEVLSKVIPGVHRVIAGYSNGGSMVTKVTGFGFPIDLAFGFDPTIWLPPKEIGRNVGITYNLNNWGLSFVGHARYSRAPNATNLPLTNQKIVMFHGNVDKAPANQKTFYDMVAKVNAMPVWTQSAPAYNEGMAVKDVSIPLGSLSTEFRPESPA